MKSAITLFMALLLQVYSLAQNHLDVTILGRWGDGEGNGMDISDNLCVTNSGSRLLIFDISQPEVPVKMGEITLENTILAIRIKDNYAFIVDGSGGLKVVDISDLQHPSRAGNYDTQGWARGIDISGNYAYIASNDAGIYIYDISNPVTCVLLSVFNTPGHACAVAVEGNYAYVADYEGGVRILDISNPSNPTEKGYYVYNGYESMSAIDTDGLHAYCGNDKYIQVLDVSNPANPTPVSYLTGFQSEIYCLKILGSNLYAGTKSKGFTIDISDPAKLQKKGITLGFHSIAISGSHAYLPGLYVYNISVPNQPVMVTKNIVLGDVSAIAVKDNLGIIGEVCNPENQTYFLRIVDLSVPEDIKELGSCPLPDFPVNVAVAGNYALIADRNSGIQVADISDPYHPILISEYKYTGTTENVVIDGDRAYVLNRDLGLRILDISSLPVLNEIGFYDSQAQAYDVCIDGNLAFHADGTDGIRVLDITEPASPVEIGYYKTPAIARGLERKDHYLVVTDYAGSILILDISNPSEPKLAWSYNEYEYYMDVTVAGNFAYFSTLYNGMTVFDISDPENTRKTGSYPEGGKNAITLSGDHFLLDSYGIVIVKTNLPLSVPEYKLTGQDPMLYFENNSCTFQLIHPEWVEMKVYDISGNYLFTLVNQLLTEGLHTIQMGNACLAKGVFLYSFSTKTSYFGGKFIRF